MKRRTLVMFLVPAIAASALGASRFPQPDFETDYTLPATPAPAAQDYAFEYLDVIILLLALSLASYFVLKRRSRKWLFSLMLFSLLYFGFYRQGCICPIGSIQNVTQALFNSGYAVPISVIAFFTLPLLFSLLFGRVFCAAVCPLGALQDMVVLKPIKLPAGVKNTLGMIPYLYLGISVLFAALGSAYLICRYDPFIAFFRMTGTFSMLMFGAVMLITGIFVARPYCRFLCPYSVLLNWTSRFAWKHMTITPNDCIQCKLCEEVCPFDSIAKPNVGLADEHRSVGKKRLGLLLFLLPFIVAGGAWIGGRFHLPLSAIDKRVSLAEQVAREEVGIATETTLESDTFRESDQTIDELFAEALGITAQFELGGWLLGGFAGLVFGCSLINMSIKRKRTDYIAENATCFSCGRCFLSCPKEHERLGIISDPLVQIDIPNLEMSTSK